MHARLSLLLPMARCHPHFRVRLTFSVKPLWKQLPKRTQTCVSMVMPNP